MAAEVASPDVRAIIEAIVDRPLAPEEYGRLRVLRARLREAYAGTFPRGGVDAFAFPSTPVLPPPLGVDDLVDVRGERLPMFPTVIRHTDPGTVAGVPMLSLPAGTSNSGLPVGLTLEGGFHDDRALLALGERVEAVLS